MKKLVKNLAAGLAVASMSMASMAYDNIYFFGDSMLDTGNAKAFSGDPAVAERFSDGLVFPDYIADHYGVDLAPSLFLLGSEHGNNYAVGGAKSRDADGNEATPDTNLPTQVNTFLTYNPVVDTESIYLGR